MLLYWYFKRSFYFFTTVPCTLLCFFLKVYGFLRSCYIDILSGLSISLLPCHVLCYFTVLYTDTCDIFLPMLYVCMILWMLCQKWRNKNYEIRNQWKSVKIYLIFPPNNSARQELGMVHDTLCLVGLSSIILRVISPWLSAMTDLQPQVSSWDMYMCCPGVGVTAATG